ncbi:MAG: cobalamin-independent methionine synthase II family protein [Deltaproteobacteria bacterium]|nr:cobalamin-independent methionine synthase II family protein [Deltaproteobacteria bacterium]
MKRSDKRILTTHAGSLLRPKALGEMLGRHSRHEAVDTAAMDSAILDATRQVVRLQAECGIDVANNGEQARESFFTYVQHRMSGFGGESDRPGFADMRSYPSFLEMIMTQIRARVQVDLLHAPKAIGEVKYLDRGPLDRECNDFTKVLAELQPNFAETFMTAPSPGIIAAAMLNEHYKNLEDYVAALAEALKVEYEAIVGHGFLLQIDAPDLAMERHVTFAQRPLKDFVGFVDLVIASINRALEKIPPDRVRLHVCWGNYEGPHNHDVGLEAILSHLYKARVGALMISMANPRHEHEYRYFERHRLPPDMNLIAGVIDTTTNYVEHPEVVAERIMRVAAAVGDPRRVLAGTDCGFETTTGLAPVAEEVVWEKLRAMRDGAAIASKHLLG